MIRVDLHLHSSASPDCDIGPERLARRCRQLGLDPIFVTDHNTIAGASRLREMGGFRVVAGEEVTTADGELVGLFLDEEIPPGLSALETATRIKAQGGVVYVEHPYDRYRRHITEEALEAIAGMIDVVEVFNARSDDRANALAQDLCDTLGAAPGAGSDSHSLRSLGSVYVQMEDFSNPSEFVQNLRSSKIVRGRNRLVLMAEARLRK